MSTNWKYIWEKVTCSFQCDRDSVHGPAHWRRVERNGLFIATRSGAVLDVVRLFAVFHDSRRQHDGPDKSHGARGAAYAASLRGVLFQLSDQHFELLDYACKWHAHGRLSDDSTIGTCWDADRLDLGRVGIAPHPAYMSTEVGRKIAVDSSLQSFLESAEAGAGTEGTLV
ncbi:MAG TPA: hypothetical protein VL361_22830 [Candidatus Limnocylindrales bacterium]|jgi:uncharacterized protein|nr:hypothetical protein [Candidatus Limnocylindrales bacterium]